MRWLLPLFVGCAPDPSDTDRDTDPVEHGVLQVPEVLGLPYIEVGDAPPVATLRIEASGPLDGFEVQVEGPITVSGDTGPFLEAGSRDLEVALDASTDAPIAVRATLRVVEQVPHDVVVGAVIGTSGLPEVSWRYADGLTQAIVALPSAPYPIDGGAWTDPSVFVGVPHGVTAPVGVVTHLHGHNAVLATMLANTSIPRLHALSGRNAVLIVPQGPVAAASGDFGKLMLPGGHARLVADAIAVLYRDGVIELPVVDGVQVVTAHSGGYLATARVIEDGGLPITAVHLFDALYGELDTYAAFAEGGGVLRSVYTSGGGTLTHNLALADTLRRAGLTVADTLDDAALDATPVAIGPSPAAHGEVMEDERSFARWQVSSGLPAHPEAPPELIEVASDGVTAVVRWREGLAAEVEGSDDGVTWELLGEGAGGATVAARGWIRARQPGGDPSDSYPGGGEDWLVIDGFDRVLGGSYTAATHPFAARVGAALHASGASNEAVASGQVALSDFDRVIWLLGDESTADRTFSQSEQDAVADYVASGGQLIVSGSEVGYATPAAFLANTLHCSFVADDAGTSEAGGYSFGVAYEEDWPDVLAGDAVLWSYATGGAAAVGWNHQVIVVGFPLETLADADLGPAVAELVAWLDAS